MRLTEKDTNSYKLKHINWTNGVQKATQKLGALEDIEEDLGVDLVRLLNIKSVIYIRNALGDIREIDTKDYGLNINLLNKAIILDRNYYFKDYGKTWFYTKEELKNGKKNR